MTIFQKIRILNLLHSSRTWKLFVIIMEEIYHRYTIHYKKRSIMHTNKENPFLYFNFANKHGSFNPLQFTKPVKIISTTAIDDVMTCLKEVDKAIDAGHYAAGYIAYEAAASFNENFPKPKKSNFPLLWFGIFKEPIQKELHVSDRFQTEEWLPTVSIEDYYMNIDKIHKLIEQNQTDQVNYTIQLESIFSGNPAAFYKQLEQAQSANYSAFLDIDQFSILSASPELFFTLENGKITTRPMKGTIDRGKTYEEDIQHAQWLTTSKKNRLENKLIVDLMQDELAKIALPGTIRVPHQYTIEKYPTVYQMTSTITADIKPDINFIDIFQALFPCGSITGIPKKETMDIIAALEQQPRDIYCGAIGWISPEKEAVFNVPIRTVLMDKQSKKAMYGVGGAITKESSKEEEYKEVLIKARLLTKKQETFELLESFGLIDGKYIVYDEHIKRLTQSARYFDFSLDLKKIHKDLQQLADKYPNGRRKVRLLLAKHGAYTVEIKKLPPIEKNITSRLAMEPVDQENLFLYHKTTNRAIYQKHLEQQQNIFDVLLWNKRNEVTEFTMGNIVVELDGKLYTPPVESGLLAGTFRESLLKKQEISERKITIPELQSCRNIWFINSVRGWIPVHFIS